MQVAARQTVIPHTTGGKIHWRDLFGSAIAWGIANAANRSPGPTVVITPDSITASRLETEIAFYASPDSHIPIHHFSDWETLPYDQFSPHQDIISDRLRCLYQLNQQQRCMILIPISTLMSRIAPASYLLAHTFFIQTGQQFDRDKVRMQLEQSGYRHVSEVMTHGEYAVRGSLFDLYPMGSELPYRIDLFDDEIDSIRLFDPETQLSTDKVDKIQLLPAHEFPITDDAISRFRSQWRKEFKGNPLDCSIYQDISNGIPAAGIEYYLPLFFENTANFFDYLPKDTLLCQIGDIYKPADHYWQTISERYEQYRHDVRRPILSPPLLYQTVPELFANMKQFPILCIDPEQAEVDESAVQFCTRTPPKLLINYKSESPLAMLAQFIHDSGYRILVCAETAGRRETLIDLLKTINMTPSIIDTWHEFINGTSQFAITVAPLSNGAIFDRQKIAVVAESQLYGDHVQQQRLSRQRQIDNDAVIKSLAELSPGTPVVHIDHGIGRYMGLQTLELGGKVNEFVTLTYAGTDKLYVPVSSLHLLSRYSGADLEHAPLHKLGSGQWEKAKSKAAKRVRDVAAELLDLFARRASRQGHAFTSPDDQYRAFAASFPFEETFDQSNAIQQVLQDMRNIKPMDRLICGDVGFGKTEVAMRAAFIAVQDGRQVVMLVPTTLLAQQHYESFKDRFADWPIRIEVISRFKSRKEQDEIINDLAKQRIDIIIGTHKLLSEQVKAPNLGLMIIDEEHRFGVRQKERLKQLRAEVDILTLTATPIPRTLNMAFSGIRDLSIIATPPAKRRAIKTFVQQHDNIIIQEAINRELMRGGQVYFVNNKIETIERVAQTIAELVPDAKVGIAHGQMRERDLERVMSDFYHQRFNVLVCTTIIETGIDVPTANTIIIDRADRFGLAQLHQLRGRVGRSHHQAYAYLLTPHPKAMTSDATKRLDAIASLEDLGIGFTLATHDLEIRGAGELLGEGQSGHMQAVGFSLFMEMLEQAVLALKAGKTPNLEKDFYTGAEVDLHLTALIPDTYLPAVHTRLQLYKRIASCKNGDDLREIKAEMIDRFGLLPDATQTLFSITELKILAQKLGIRKLEAGPSGGKVVFSSEPNVDPEHLIKLIQQQPKLLRFDGPETLRFMFEEEITGEARIDAVGEFLHRLKSS